MADNKKTKKPKNDLTDVKNVHEDTLTFNANGNMSGTISTNTLIINDSHTFFRNSFGIPR